MENREIFYDRSWCQVYFLEVCQAVELVWVGATTSERFREACDASLQLLINKKADRMLADNRLAEQLVSPEDTSWIQREWFPKAYEAGYRGSAILEAEDAFRKLSVKNIVNHMDKGKFVVQYFEHRADALEWLLEFKALPRK